MWTVPNLLGMLRLAGVPVFPLARPRAPRPTAGPSPPSRSWASPFLDSYLARRLRQTSALGRVLDPVADRLYILAVVVGLALRG